MELTQKIKDKMQEYYEKVKNEGLYGDNSIEKRKDLGQFYTPAELGAKMLEKYDCTLEEFKTKTILDPTMGSGLLLAYSLIAGADPERVFGIELDPTVLELGQKRLCDEGIEDADGNIKKVPKYNLHHGNALNHDCYCFPESKYETEHVGKTYTFDPNRGDVGYVDFKNPDGTSGFKFGGF